MNADLSGVQAAAHELFMTLRRLAADCMERAKAPGGGVTDQIMAAIYFDCSEQLETAILLPHSPEPERDAVCKCGDPANWDGDHVHCRRQKCGMGREGTCCHCGCTAPAGAS